MARVSEVLRTARQASYDAADSIGPLLQDTSPELRAVACTALEQLLDSLKSKAVKQLEALQDDPDRSVRFKAALVRARLGDFRGATALVSVALEILAQPSVDDPYMFADAAIVLHELGYAEGGTVLARLVAHPGDWPHAGDAPKHWHLRSLAKDLRTLADDALRGRIKLLPTWQQYAMPEGYGPARDTS